MSTLSVALSHVPSLIPLKTLYRSSSPSCSSEPSRQSIAPTPPLALTSVTTSPAACSTGSASLAACHLSRPSSTDARTPTPLDPCSSTHPATPPRHLSPAWNPPEATATHGTTAASTSRTARNTTTPTVGPCQPRASSLNSLLARLRLETLRRVTTRGAPSIAVAPALLILHLDTRLLLGLLVK